MTEAITIDSTVAEIPAQPANEHADEHWDLVIQPKRHLLDINFKELWDYRDLLYMFVHRDIVTVYKQTILGPIWFFVQPIMTTVIYLFVFGTIAKISTDGIPGILFYLSGIVMWNYFAESFNRTSSTFVGNAGIFGKVYFPRLIVPLSLVASGLIKFLIQFTLFLAAFVYYLNTTDVIHPNAWLLATPYLILLMAGLGLGFGIIFSSLTTKYRDLTFLIQFGVQLAMYATPIIYPMSILGPRARAILWWNPIAHLIETMKYGFLGAGDVSVAGLAYATLFTVIVLGAGIVIFNRTEQSFMDTV
ncbi:MAG: ABC transporter permease [Rubinisphaera brasiliensis]|uniref:ABC transporter permease n=1 Tax=Rubinisphaera brasiliensis TaxID=119 RepID=UPI00391A30B4